MSERDEMIRREVAEHRCRHFSRNGLEIVCAAGVDVIEHVGGRTPGWGRRLPCHTGASTFPMFADEVRPCGQFLEQGLDVIERDVDETLRVAMAVVAGRSPSRGILLEMGALWWSEAGQEATCRVCGRVAADDPEGTFQWRGADGEITCAPCMPPATHEPYSVTACCPDCGRVTFDEDGCCDICGLDTDANGDPVNGGQS